MPVLRYLPRQSKIFVGAPQQIYATRDSSVDIALVHGLISFQHSVIPSGRKWANNAVPPLGRAHIPASDVVRRIKDREQSPGDLSLMPQKTKGKDLLPERGVSSTQVQSFLPLP